MLLLYPQKSVSSPDGFPLDFDGIILDPLTHLPLKVWLNTPLSKSENTTDLQKSDESSFSP